MLPVIEASQPRGQLLLRACSCPRLTRAVHHLPVCRLGPSSAALASTQRTNSVLPGKPRASQLCGIPVASACWARVAGHYLARPQPQRLLRTWRSCRDTVLNCCVCGGDMQPKRHLEQRALHFLVPDLVSNSASMPIICCGGRAKRAGEHVMGKMAHTAQLQGCFESWQMCHVPPCFAAATAAVALQPRWNHQPCDRRRPALCLQALPPGHQEPSCRCAHAICERPGWGPAVNSAACGSPRSTMVQHAAVCMPPNAE
jgi:hypothetical protein